MIETHTPENIRQIADSLAAMVAGGLTVEGAMATQTYVPQDLLKLGRLHYEKAVGAIIDVSDPGSLVADEVKKGVWYAGPRSEDKLWPALREYLGQDLPDDVVASIDDSSSKIIGLGKPPGSHPINTRGLVLGYVQSGKTTNFMSVIAKAADVGYRLVIILTGTTENLRVQTQERVDEYLVETSGRAWNQLTTVNHDFSETTPSSGVLKQKSLRSIAVVKKNPGRLRRLKSWIDSANQMTLNGLPVLIIDDEADQASIDVGTKRQSTINGLIRDILSLPRAQYIAYTATPFANFLIDTKTSDDLYPRDFIVNLPRPDNYFGAEKIFGNPESTGDDDTDDGLDIVREIPVDDALEIRPPRGKAAVQGWEPEIPDSLRTSILWFILATAARRHRSSKISHSSMLVHSSMSADAHEKTADAINDCLQDVRAELVSSHSDLWTELEELWEMEATRIPPEDFGNVPIAFADLAPDVLRISLQINIVVDNYRSLDRLHYPKKEPQTVIVIGGNTLSRGLTLEGLTSSYFVRAASAYDTLLQMGRWFGYRAGYEDLVRIWMTAELQNWFIMLGIVEADIRHEIEVYEKEGKTPADLPVKIRTHPQMSVTSAAKMKNSIKTQISYSGKRVQTILFRDEDAGWLGANVDAFENLIASCRNRGHDENELPGEKRGFSNVDVDLILSFLNDYLLHENAQSIDKDLVRKYIERENRSSALLKWNVVILEPDSGLIKGDSFGLESPIRFMRRRKMYIAGQYGTANLKAIASRTDRVADLDITTDTMRKTLGLSNKDNPSDEQLLRIRSARGMDKIGLLCIYPIASSSEEDRLDVLEPQGIERKRTPLSAVDNLIGVCFMFPRSTTPESAVEYISANVEPDYIEDIETEQREADDLDEAQAKKQEQDHSA